jgi:hypothetical protein
MDFDAIFLKSNSPLQGEPALPGFVLKLAKVFK